MDSAKRGSDALEANKPLEALVEYTQALIEHPSSPDYHIQRSIAFTRAGNHQLALEDSDRALHFGHQRSKREIIQAAQHRRVVALYNLGRYGDAKHLLDSMEKWVNPTGQNKETMQFKMWQTKVANKLKTATDEQKTVTVKEKPKLHLPTEKVRVNNFKRQIKSDGTYNFEWENEEEIVPSATTNTTSEQQETSTPTISATPGGKVRHEWYQNNQCVIVTIYAKGVNKEKAEIDIQDDSITVSFPDPTNPTTTFSITFDPLFALINPSNSTHRILSTKIEITLQKSIAGQKWHSLEGSALLKPSSNGTDSNSNTAVKSLLQQTPIPTTAPVYPTSSKSGPKNWDKVAADFTKKKLSQKSPSDNQDEDDKTKPDEDEDDMLINSSDDDGANDGVDSFFKKLYKDSDDDTRRAMMKSFQESNGTALSTNWEDVGKKRVEVVESKDD